MPHPRIHFSPAEIPKSFLFFSFLNIYFLIFREGGGREKERETDIDQLPLARPQPGARPTMQACAPTRNRGDIPLVLGLAHDPLSHTSQGLTRALTLVIKGVLFFLFNLVKFRVKVKITSRFRA